MRLDALFTKYILKLLLNAASVRQTDLCTGLGNQANGLGSAPFFFVEEPSATSSLGQ